MTLIALLIRVGFAIAYVGVGRIKHAPKPAVPWEQLEFLSCARGAFSELGSVGGNLDNNPVLAAVDQDGYTVLGMRMISGEPYDDTRRQPLYPALHALVFLVFGKHPTLLYNRLAGAVLSALASAVIYLLARRMFGRTVGLIAGLISAVHLNLIHKSGYIYSEILAVPLTALALCFFLAYSDDRKPRQLILGGLMLGLATLARPTTFLMIFLLPLWLWVVCGKVNRQMLARSVTVVAVSLMVLAPWAVRNLILTGRFIPVSRTRGWSLVCGCYGPAQFEQPLGQNKGLWNGLEHCGLFTNEELARLAVADEEEQQRACKRRFFDYLPTMWARIPELMLYRELVFVGFDSRSGIFRFYQVQQIALFALFVGGLWISRAQWRRFSVLYLAYLFLGVFMILALLGGSRMRLYVDPIIIVFAAAYVVRLAEKCVVRKRQRGQHLESQPLSGVHDEGNTPAVNSSAEARA